MRYFVKGIILSAIVVVALFLGTFLLSEFVWWKLLIFALVCGGVGAALYRLFGLVDIRHNKKIAKQDSGEDPKSGEQKNN